MFLRDSPAKALLIVVSNKPIKLVDIETRTPNSRFLIDSSVISPAPSKPPMNIEIPRNTPANVPIRPRYVGNANFATDWSYRMFSLRSTLFWITAKSVVPFVFAT